VEEDMNWKRVVGYGFALWLVPFVSAFLLFSVRQSNRALFESLITVIGVACAVMASLLYFRDAANTGLAIGLAVGFAWAAISIGIDLPIFLKLFQMPLPVYAADIALTYLAFPLITIGIALARRAGQKAAGT
jgi:hypothetical protein